MPVQLGTIRSLDGTTWSPAEGPKQVIADWLNAIANRFPDMASYCNSVIHQDYFAWCGLTVGYCFAVNGVAPVFGVTDTDKFLWAMAWLEWGTAVQTPQPGDVVVFDFGHGDQHVSLFEADNGNGYWACHGGNQGHAVNLSNFPRSSVRGIRRPS